METNCTYQQITGFGPLILSAVPKVCQCFQWYTYFILQNQGGSSLYPDESFGNEKKDGYTDKSITDLINL